MAYNNLLASVPIGEVERFQADPTLIVTPTLILPVSHAFSSWITVQPLGGLLKRCLDGGRPIHPMLWHPFRVPVYHEPPTVAELFQSVGDAWEATSAEHVHEDDNWLSPGLDRLLQVFGAATERGEAIVSALAPPDDPERAAGCRLPWQPIRLSDPVATTRRPERDHVGQDQVSNGIRRWLTRILTSNSSKRS